MKYYSLNRILKKEATYNVIFGERSNGKTYGTLKHGLERYFKDGKEIAIVRRWKEDIRGRRASDIFSALIADKVIEKLSNGEFQGIHYYSGKFYLCSYDENGKPIYSNTDIIAHAFALSDNEHNKSISFPNVGTIIFDEFLTNKLYLHDEFILFMNTLSTIIRQRLDVSIFMLGNTVNKYCPYFEEMGLKHIAKMKQGSIDVYTYGDSKLTVAVEYCASTSDSKSNNHYFAFDNPKLKMITSGAWELDIYPHLPSKYKSKNILLTYFIEFADNIYQCEIIDVNGELFTYIHIKTTEIRDPDEAIIYSLDYNYKANYSRNIYKPMSKIHTNILWFFKFDKVFYQNNDVGDSISNYLKICRKGLM